jgi:quercetin dioxygenase-like cupin family protein
MPLIHPVSITLMAAGVLSAAPAIAQKVAANVQVHGSSGDTTEPVQRALNQIIFTPTKGKRGIASARLAGNPAEPGLYVVMVKMADGAENASHTHPDGRITTVLRGKILYGIGETIDRAKAKVYEAGAYYYTPPNAPHYLVSMAPDTLYQEVGVGPSASHPVVTK